GRAEPAREVETFSVRVSRHMQEPRRTLLRNGSTMIDQLPAHSVFPGVRLDEQRVQFSLPVGPWNDGGEAQDLAEPLRHEDVSLGDVVDWNADGVRMREQRIPIAWFGQRCSPFQ